MSGEITITETPTACAGAATSFVLRQIAYRAGTLAPGIQDAIFHELHAAEHGDRLSVVESWFARRARVLHELGYRLRYRRIASPTRELVAWVEAGRGYRGAVLATSYQRLHPDATAAGELIVHAVGVVVEHRAADGEDSVAMIDPWSRTFIGPCSLPSTLDAAHAEREYQALAFHWIGWS
ncbi:MAG TPA: hypothetical protein VLX92_19340 [Kofleriaceae bacterium]|nr:hypothetical protein [Kofleriaceae bacterium]